jgi:hypothetical protein
MNCGDAAAEDALPLVFEEDFENGAERWEPTDANAWMIQETDKGHVYSQFEKRSKYEPPHRSPYNISLLKDFHVGDFVLDADVLSTHEDYGHRDACLVFGYQDPAHFYYVHLGKKTDDHANQIFIVNEAPRTKISTKTTPRRHRERIGTTNGITCGSPAIQNPVRFRFTTTICKRPL